MSFGAFRRRDKLTVVAPDELAFPPGAAGSRASDRDREQALEQLSNAASDGRLTLEEYSAALIGHCRRASWASWPS